MFLSRLGFSMSPIFNKVVFDALVGNFELKWGIIFESLFMWKPKRTKLRKFNIEGVGWLLFFTCMSIRYRGGDCYFSHVFHMSWCTWKRVALPREFGDLEAHSLATHAEFSVAIAEAKQNPKKWKK